jgi:pimeloyl-ACP methyl ester carboxylesterase
VKHAVIYIPGLGDHRTYGQKVGLNIWRLFGLKPTYLALGWANKEGLDAKLARLDTLVQQKIARGYTVSLVGVSAGASAVLIYYQNHPEIHKVVLVCGKVNYPENIHPLRFRHNPDFATSMQLVGSALTAVHRNGLEKNIASFYCVRDTTVPRKDTYIAGAYNRKIWGFSHATAILAGVVFYGRVVATFLKTHS